MQVKALVNRGFLCRALDRGLFNPSDSDVEATSFLLGPALLGAMTAAMATLGDISRMFLVAATARVAIDMVRDCTLPCSTNSDMNCVAVDLHPRRPCPPRTAPCPAAGRARAAPAAPASVERQRRRGKRAPVERTTAKAMAEAAEKKAANSTSPSPVAPAASAATKEL